MSHEPRFAITVTTECGQPVLTARDVDYDAMCNMEAAADAAGHACHVTESEPTLDDQLIEAQAMLAQSRQLLRELEANPYTSGDCDYVERLHDVQYYADLVACLTESLAVDEPAATLGQ